LKGDEIYRYYDSIFATKFLSQVIDNGIVL